MPVEITKNAIIMQDSYERYTLDADGVNANDDAVFGEFVGERFEDLDDAKSAADYLNESAAALADDLGNAPVVVRVVEV